MSVRIPSSLQNDNMKNNQENSHTVIFLKNYGNLSGGVKTRKIITPSRSVRSLTGFVGSIKTVNGDVGSVKSIRRGIPVKGENIFKSNISNFDDKNNQNTSLSNKNSNLNNNSFLFSSNKPLYNSEFLTNSSYTDFQ